MFEVIFSIVFIVLIAKWLSRGNVRRVTSVLILSIFGCCIYRAHLTKNIPVAEEVSCCSNCHDNVRVKRYVVNNVIGESAFSIVSGINAFASSRWDDDVLCGRSMLIAWCYLALEYFTLIFGIALGFSVLGRRLINTIFAWRYLFVTILARCGHLKLADRFVFWGYSKDTVAMLRDFLRSQPSHWLCRPVVALVQDEGILESLRRARFDDLEDLKAMPIYENFTCGLRSGALTVDDKIPWWSRWRLWARHHLILGDDERINVMLCKMLVNSIRCSGAGSSGAIRITIYVRVYSRTAAEELSIWVSKGEHKRHMEACGVAVKILSVPDMLAQSFVRAHPLIGQFGTQSNLQNNAAFGIDLERLRKDIEANATRDGDFQKVRLLIVGLGRYGRALLNAEVCDVQCEGVDFEATVVDADRLKCDDYKLDYGEYALGDSDGKVNETAFPEARYKISFVDKIDALSVDFSQWFEGLIAEKGKSPFTRIIVSLRDVRMNRLVAMRIATMLEALGCDYNEVKNIVFACGENDLNEGLSESCHYTPFGRVDEVFTFDNVIEERSLELAKIIHNSYCQYRFDGEGATARLSYDSSGSEEEINDKWSKASYYERRSSIACAQGVENWLRVGGWRWRVNKTPFDVEANDGCDAAIGFINDHLDYFARSEHLRWIAYQIMAGVRHAGGMDKEDLYFSEKKGYSAKICDADGLVRRHAAIIQFDMLEQLDACIDRYNHEWVDNSTMTPPPKTPYISVLAQTDSQILIAILDRLMKARKNCIGVNDVRV